jgi:hypothetical protein
MKLQQFRSKWLGYLATTSVIAIFAWSIPQTFAAFTATTSISANSATAGTVGIQIVDGSGNVLTSPVFSIEDAYPAMQAQVSTVRLSNTGSITSAVQLFSRNLTPSAANLDDVLQLEVLDSDSTQLFLGKISEFDVLLASIPAGTLKVLTFKITWPDLAGVNDNPYQAATLNFELAADSESIPTA